MKLPIYKNIFKKPLRLGTTDSTFKMFGIPDCAYQGSEDTLIESRKDHSLSDPAQKKSKSTIVHCLVYVGNRPSVCPKCGSRMYKHGDRFANVIDIPQGSKCTVLQIKYPRMRCSNKECSLLWEPALESVVPHQNITRRAYQEIAQEAMSGQFRQIQNHYPISHVSIRAKYLNTLKDEAAQLAFAMPVYMGMDEIKIRGIGEVTVITDLEHKTVFDILNGRSQTFLNDYFGKIPLELRLLVKWVCTDMYRPFQATLEIYFPNARWVIDHFHVVMKANEALDEVRRIVQMRLTSKQRKSTKSGLAYTLKKRMRDLSAEEKQLLKDLRSDPLYADVVIAFDLKEGFFNIYDNNPTSKENAIRDFELWAANLPPEPPQTGDPNDRTRDPFKKFRELVATVRHYQEEIFNYWDCDVAITNAFTECTNRMIRECIMKGRGYSFDVLRGKILYGNHNLEMLKTSNGLLYGPSVVSGSGMFGDKYLKSEPANDQEDEEDVPF